MRKRAMRVPLGGPTTAPHVHVMADKGSNKAVASLTNGDHIASPPVDLSDRMSGVLLFYGEYGRPARIFVSNTQILDGQCEFGPDDKLALLCEFEFEKEVRVRHNGLTLFRFAAIDLTQVGAVDALEPLSFGQWLIDFYAGRMAGTYFHFLEKKTCG